MTTTVMNFDPTLRGTAAETTTNGQQETVGTGASVAVTTAGEGKLQEFEGFLRRAGHVAGVVLGDLVKFVVPVAQVAALVDPSAAAAVKAFTTSVQLVQATVISAQQRWAAEGTAANDKKLADVLTVVEQPIIQMFEQVGLHVDSAYVVNLVNGVVAILNAQPAATLATSSAV